jgi:Sulfatase
VPAPSDAASREPSAIRVGAGLFAGFALLAAVNAVAIDIGVPLPSGGVPLRLAHHLFDAAETIGVGASLALAVGLFVRFTRLPAWAFGVLLFFANVAITYRVAGDYLLLAAAHALDGRYATTVFIFWMGLYGMVLALAPAIAATWLEHPRLRFLPLPLAIVAMVANQIPLRDDYLDLHGVVAWGAVLLGGAALAPQAERLGRRLAESVHGKVELGAVAVVALFGVAFPPPNATRFELFRQPAAVAPWVLATLVWRAPRLHAPVSLPPSPWREERKDLPPIPPTETRLLPPNAVIVFITVDAVRAEVVDNPANDDRLTTFAELKRKGVYFTDASTPGAQTGVSLNAMFSGLYYSEERWDDYGDGKNRHPYASTSEAPRFPELLSEHGVDTVNFASLVFLRGDFGVDRGFREEKVLGTDRHAAPGPGLVSAVLGRLNHAGDGPLFIYTHLCEPHAPYTGGQPGDTSYQRYLTRVEMADRLLGRVLKVLEERFGDRWALFVSADHGEAFGDHQTTEHSKTVYEELLHVPLLAQSPHFVPRSIDTPVALIDMGPTLLDLFGVDTPATFNGQSLVPLLAGKTESLTRPIIAEGRLRRSLTGPDGLKVIEDLRRKVVEVYDLHSDPGETRNLFDVDPARSDVALAELRAFFAVHTYTADGYEPRYKL